MSKKSHNNYGVPWYASSKTPSIRSRAAREIPTWVEEKYNEAKAYKMQALKYVRSWVRENWKEGDRFVYEEILEENSFIPPGVDRKQPVKITGTFKTIRQQGYYWFVKVDFDEPQKDRNSGLGLFSFCRFADKLEVKDEVQEV